jgi:hypothetical protein
MRALPSLVLAVSVMVACRPTPEFNGPLASLADSLLNGRDLECGSFPFDSALIGPMSPYDQGQFPLRLCGDSASNPAISLTVDATGKVLEVGRLFRPGAPQSDSIYSALESEGTAAYGQPSRCPIAHNSPPGELYWQHSDGFVRLERVGASFVAIESALGKGWCTALLDPG